MRAFKSHSAVSTAAIAHAHTPARPWLRTALTIAM